MDRFSFFAFVEATRELYTSKPHLLWNLIEEFRFPVLNYEL
jgi:hypothetical protein